MSTRDARAHEKPAEPPEVEIRLDILSPDAEKNDDFSDPATKRRQLENDSLAQDIKARETYARYASYVSFAWIVFVMAVTCAQIYLNASRGGLSDTAYIAMITTTTASVLAMWGIVSRNLFGPSR